MFVPFVFVKEKLFKYQIYRKYSINIPKSQNKNPMPEYTEWD